MINLKSKSIRRPVNLFFIEIIIALLFFSISGVVILKMFAQADSKSRYSAELENVIVYAQSLAEVYSECGNAEQAAKVVWDELTVTKDGNCTQINPAGEGFILKAYEEQKPTDAGTISKLHMEFLADEKEIYTLDCSAYISNERGEWH